MNNALNFDGKSNYIEVATNNLLNFGNANGYAIMCWMKTNTTDKVANYTGLVVKANATSPSIGWQLLIFNNCIAAEIWGSDKTMIGPKDGLVGTTPLNDGQWHNVAITVDRQAGTAVLYVDGVAEKTITNDKLKKNPDNTASLLIGVERTKALYFSGALDQVNIWSRALDAHEIQYFRDTEPASSAYKLVSSFSLNNGYPGIENTWWEAANILPNRVVAAGDGELKNFAREGSTSNWAKSEVKLQSKLAPVYRLTANDAKGWLYTMSRQEAEDRLNDHTFSDMIEAFYAFDAPAPGTVPLNRFFAKDWTGDHFYTSNQAERHNVVSKDWYTYEGIMGYVVPRQSNSVVPLYRVWNPKNGLHFYSIDKAEIAKKLAEGFNDEGIAGYVFSSVDAVWNPQPFRVYPDMPQISQDIWYVIVNRKFMNESGLFMTDHNTVEMREIPMNGDYTAFQWLVAPNPSDSQAYFLINRKYPEKALDCSATEGPTVGGKDSKYGGQQWKLTPFANNGTDTFSLSNNFIKEAKSISFDGNRFSTEQTNLSDLSQAFTFVAMELNDGYFIPGISGNDQVFPYNKKLITSQELEIIGTGTTSEWAMLRAWVIYENMILNVKDNYSHAQLQGRKVIIISKDDSNDEASRYPLIMPVASSETLCRYRGSEFPVASNEFALITEEMMCKTGVVNRPGDSAYRRWDQLTHEFAHLIDQLMDLNGDSTPSCALNIPKECFAGATSAWYDTNLTYPSLNAPTRDELKANQTSLYGFLAARFKEENTWQPPAQLRERY